MDRPTTGQWVRRWSGFIASLLLLETAAGAAGARSTRVLIPGPTGHVVRSAIDGAIRRLEQPRCAAVFGEFQTSDGVVLAAHLTALSLTPSQYLRTLWFADADDLSRCHEPNGPIAFTAPGHPVVYVCGEHFSSMYARNRTYAETTVIHEVLHAAGLGENPPTSEYISRVARARCTSAG